MARSAAEVPEWFKTQYMEAVARLELPLQNLRCRFEASGVDGQGCFGYRGDFFLKDGSREVVRIGPNRGGKPQQEDATVICLTAQRFFLLEKPLGGSSFVIRALDDLKEPEQRRWYEALTEFNAANFVEAAFRMDDPVKTLLTDDTVTRFDAARVRRDGHEYVELRCTFSDACNYERATAMLDPEMDFAVCNYEIVIRGPPGTVSIRKGFVECERWVGSGLVFPKRVRIEGDTRTGEGERYFKTQEMVLDDARINEVEDTQFSLTAFGLPEICLTPQSHSPDIAFELPLYTIETSGCGEIRDLPVTLRNGSRRPIHVVGAAEICSHAGCNRVGGLPVEIPSGETAVIHVEFHTRAHPGEGLAEIPFYLDHPDLPIVTLRVRCIGRPQP